MSSLRRALFWLLILSVAAAFYSIKLSQARRIQTEKPRAFLDASWGMSKEEVQRVNRLPLVERSDSALRFYTPRPGIEDSRYQTWRSEGQRFLGRTAVIHYTFLDDRLFAFHVFITDSDGQKLDSDMRRYLVARFGTQFSREEEDPALKLLWQSKERTVNYWFYERESSLLGRFKAGYGALYHSFERPSAVDS